MAKDFKINLPDFFEDPLFRESQETLWNTSKNLLAGTPGEYYSPIGEFGSNEFENILQMTQRDIQKSGLVSAAKMGTRGGAVNANIARTTADTTSKLRFEDLLRGIEGRKFLLGQGMSGGAGVSGRALNFGNAKSSYNLNKAGLEFDIQKAQNVMDQNEDAAEGALWGSILSSGLGALGTIGGAYLGGPVGASAGASLGSALGTGLTSKDASFGDLFSNIDFSSYR